MSSLNAPPQRSRRTACILALAALLAAGSATAQEEALGAAPPVLRAKPARAAVAPSTRLGLATAFDRVPQVALSALDVAPLLAEDAQLSSTTKVLRLGVPRPLALRATDGIWHDLPGGARLWAVEVVSPGAVGLRLHLADLRLPAGAELAVFAPSAGGHVEILRSAANDGSHWTATTAGERVRLELSLPAGRERRLPFRVDSLQHLYRDLLAEPSLLAKAAGPCHNDVTCYPDYAALSRAVGLVTFVGPRGVGACTGQLLNIGGRSPDFTPYFLTANHCVDSGEEAASAEVFWAYQTAECGGAPPSLGDLQRSVGATVVATGATSDFTLLMIDGTVPRDLFWAGWTSKRLRSGQPAVAVHHPSADFKRISFGRQGAGGCPPGGNLVQVDWYEGPTEPGSSGSGIFTDDPKQQLFGQLSGGPSSCDQITFDCYGAFTASYRYLRSPLKGGSDDNLDQNDSCKKARRVRPGVFAGRVVKAFDEDWYRVDVPAGRTARVDLAFAHANGDVDLEAYAACGGDAVAASLGVEDGEALALTNVGSRTATLRFRVKLASDTRAVYDLAVAIE